MLRADTTFDIASYFRDPDGDTLRYTATSANSDIVRVAIQHSDLTLSGGKTPDEADVTIQAYDSDSASSSQMFTVTVINRPPVIATPIPNLALVPGNDTTFSLASRPWINGSSGKVACAWWRRGTNSPGCAGRPVLGLCSPDSRL